jgi:hypothetical protein
MILPIISEVSPLLKELPDVQEPIAIGYDATGDDSSTIADFIKRKNE